MSYSICFRRFWNSTVLELTPEIFQLAYLDDIPNNTGLDSHCQTTTIPPGVDPDDFSEDFMFLPNAQFETNQIITRATRFCGTSIQKQKVLLTIPGPFAIQFQSDKFTADRPQAIGFKIHYKVY